MRVGKQQGFSAAEALLVLVVLAVIGLTSWWGWRAAHAGAPPGKSGAAKPAVATETGPYAGWHTYTSSRGKFRLRYPAGWAVSGFRGEVPVAATSFNGQETQLRFLRNEGQNQFGLNISVFGLDGPGVLGNGSVTQLKNGLSAWVSNPGVPPCASLQLVSGGRFSAQLTNGTRLSASGSYCWSQGAQPTYSYMQQVQSDSFRQAEQILASIETQ